MPIYKITHETVYDYSEPVLYSNHLAHLLPRKVPRQNWLDHSVEIDPSPTAQQTRIDIFGNTALAFSVEKEHRKFSFKTTGIVEVSAEKIPETSLPWEEIAEKIMRPQNAEELEASMYAFNSPFAVYDDSVRHYALDSFTPKRPMLDACQELMTRIYTDCAYTPGATRIGSLPPEILRIRKGVCQDFSHLMIACLRSLHLPCRYISGYLKTHTLADAQNLVGADATHAWVSSYFPNHGWVEFDPTNNIFGGLEHIIIAWGRDFGDVSPLKGVITGGGSHSLKVAVHVELSRKEERKGDDHEF
ncbi:transglutaminase family protein [uncultured Fibrobacter sp.]|uniref:transglutaminase family protein n=1 Tax=uncultured Fibrobacter sp. TaxID=261512 RepID=UPI002805FCD6|nr:transglutaminase family protein [uncultured Fibrobacter sp.]